MSCNNWSSSSSAISRLPLSTTTNFNDIEQEHHYHYHHHYAPIFHPLFTNYQQQNSEPSNSLSIIPSIPMIDHQVPLKYKENFHRNSTLKLRRCVALFLHLIGMNFNKKFHIENNCFIL